MGRSENVLTQVAVLAVLFGLTRTCMGQQMVIVRPKQTDAILANPHMGWETFHRTADQDRNLPSWIPSTVHYARWGWGELEPQPGKIDYEFLDRILAETRQAGQTLAFRVMCCSTTPGRPYHPAWLKEIGGRVLKARRRGGPWLEVPDLDDPVVLRAHLDFIARLGERYDGHPIIDHIDLGSVGWWGEWHMSGAEGAQMPKPETQKAIVDAYLNAFKKTPLLMLIGGGPMLKYAVEHGCGWRADCLGDMGGFSRNWCHMRNAYPVMLPEANALEAWKHAPVAWETCWDIRKWVEEGWSLRFIFNYALALHGSYINNKSAPLPNDPQVHEEIRRFLRRLGYRLVIERLEHPATIARGNRLTIRTVWRNYGSAPCYKPYRMAVRLSGLQTSSVYVTDFAINGIMPGEIPLFDEDFFAGPPDLPPGPPVDATVQVPLNPSLPSGTYKLAIAVVDPETGAPVVQLGIEGRESDGWYTLSSIDVR